MIEQRSYNLVIDPADLLEVLRDEPGVFLLESSIQQAERGRYSFIGYDPFGAVKGNDLETFAKLKKEYLRFHDSSTSKLTPFAAGIMGYLSYDFGLQFENMKSRHKDELSIPGCCFGFYDRIITIDHFKKKIIVTSNGLPQTNIKLRKERAIARLNEFEKILKDVPVAHRARHGHEMPLRLDSDFNKVQYCRAVEKALDYIRQGDIYQVNLSQAFSGISRNSVNSSALYRTLRNLSPSCFGGYFNGGAFQIISSSPELFLSMDKGMVETRPMKGTRARGQTPMNDRFHRQDLVQSAKEKAELLMVTDLERNDLGRVCEFGSIKVQRIREIEKYRTVFQATATVKGKLAKGKDGFDLLQASFPGGSVTGCPKIRAMQIIDELEAVRRGIYTGAMGYMSFSGEMAFNILIRTILVRGQKLSFHVGGGIVADSQPDFEYDETLVKAQAMRESLAKV